MSRPPVGLVALLWLLLVGPELARGDSFAWVEGETPTRANVKANLAGWGNKSFLSGEKWLHLSVDAEKVEAEVPAEGALFLYEMELPEAGSYEAWARIGFEFARSPFDWRLDDGPWTRVEPSELTTDLMEIDFFCEVAWLKLGERSLGGGKHALEVRLPKLKGGEGKTARVLFALDAVCLHKGPFVPFSKFKPGEDHRDEVDRKAEAQVFRLPEPGPEGARSSVSLSGLWEVCRFDEQTPGPVAEPIGGRPEHPRWRGIRVPGDKNTARPDLVFAHRLWYRTRVDVPTGASGRSFVLEFPQNSLNTTVVVNGVPCGFSKNPFAAAAIDVTKGIRPGTNEIWVGIRDAWYGRSADPDDPLRLRKTFNLPLKFFSDGFQDLAYPIWGAPQSGILATPLLSCVGPAYAADVFCKPSVARKTLDVDVTVANPGARPAKGELVCEAIDERGRVVKRLEAREFSVEAGGSALVTASGGWADATLWWPDRPRLYRLRTTVRVDGNALDVRETPFGFREWGVDGKRFTLNGVPFHGWAGGGDDSGTPDEWLGHYRAENQKMMRFWGTSWKGLATEAALEFFDRSGVVVRRSGMLDGEAIGYFAVEPNEAARKRLGSEIKLDLMANWRDQMVAQVKGERNHPSVMLWSIENEWLYINCINLYGNLMDGFESEVRKTSETVHAADPTRSTMTDGGGANKDQSMPVHGSHYVVGPFPRYPTLAYETNIEGGGRGRWIWDQKRPRFVGEDFFMTGNHPELSYFGGEAAFLGKQGTGPATGLALRMLQEGYRWADFGAWQFWLGLADTDGQHLRSYADRAALCRQWDWTFGPGQSVRRRVALFNDTHDATPLRFSKVLTIGGATVAKEETEHRVPPGGREELDLTLAIPRNLRGRVEGTWALKLSAGGRTVFEDVKPLSVLEDAHSPLKGALLVFDPSGEVGEFFQEHRQPFTPLHDLKTLPADAKVLVVGRDALDAAEGASSRLAAYAADGHGVVVLEQKHPLKYQALPTAMEAASNEGRTAFVEDSEHPALKGLESRDFFTWGPDEVVYRDAYLKPTRGAKSLVQCGEMLQNSGLVEVPVGKGVLLLSQLTVGRKLAEVAPARRLFANLLGAAASYRFETRPVLACVEGSSPLAAALDGLGLKYASVSNPLAALENAQGIAIVSATPNHLRALAGGQAVVDKFVEGGGRLILNGLTPEGLADFNRLVGFDHMIRPFGRERVTFPPLRHPLTAGLTGNEIAMYSSERIFPWTAGNFTASDEFSYVVDLDDVAPFAQFPNDFLRNMVNGFVSADAWKYIVNVPAPDSPPLDFALKFPKPQEIAGVEWVGNTFYYPVTRFELLFDGKQAVSFDVKPTNDPQTFRVDPPRSGTDLTLRLAAWDKIPGKQQVTGLDNIRLLARRPAAFSKKVRPLLNIGALVEYPRGRGGIVLANLLFKDSEEVPENTGKKRAILAAILRNLKAPFGGGGAVVAGSSLDYRPVDLSGRFNGYRTDRGWFGDPKFTFADLPAGRQTFAGVPFEVYDFPTSPVPTVILTGKGAPGGDLKPIPLSGKADALFFLQAARVDARRSAEEVKAGTASELARYVVTYEDGRTAEIPVRAELDVDDAKQVTPAALPGSQVAWTRPYPGTEFSAVAYAQPWNNPRPDVPLRSLTLQPGANGNRGALALIAVTAASARSSESSARPLR